MKPKIELEIKNNKEFQDIIKDIIENETVQEMKNYRQHFDTDCFEHCYLVSYYSYLICKKYNLDYVSMARAAMVHDLFLYDWREPSTTHTFHAFSHGRVACKKASELFELNDKEKDIITNHMWPVTPKIPKYKETFIITLVDKYCATMETKEGFTKHLKKSKVFQYAMMFLFVFLCRGNH